MPTLQWYDCYISAGGSSRGLNVAILPLDYHSLGAGSHMLSRYYTYRIRKSLGTPLMLEGFCFVISITDLGRFNAEMDVDGGGGRRKGN
jgi:hypothetical protein